MRLKKAKVNAGELLERVRLDKPLVHHLTNWVTIYDCANIVKVMGGSPIMAHAQEEVAQMSGIASALVLNIGTLTVDFVQAMKIAAASANKKGIPVVLDICGAGATELRDKKSFELLDEVRIDIIKGNSSEVARIAGENVQTKGVDAAHVQMDLKSLAFALAKRRRCTVVITGQTDIITDTKSTYLVRNGHPMMAKFVGSGCMATSCIGTFAAVKPDDLAYASCAALVCFEIAAQCAAKQAKGPGSFKEAIFDYLYHLDTKTINRLSKVEKV